MCSDDVRNHTLLILLFLLAFGCTSSYDMRMKAVEAKDPSLCDGIASGDVERDNCYYHVAVVKNDSLVCDGVQGHDLRQYCLAMTQNDPDMCESMLDAFQRGECLGSVAIMTGSHDTCDRIENGEQRSQCHEYVTETHPFKWVIEFPEA